MSTTTLACAGTLSVATMTEPAEYGEADCSWQDFGHPLGDRT